MRFEVKAVHRDKTYTIYRTNEIENASAFAEGFFIKNDYQKVYVTRRGHVEIVRDAKGELKWEKKI